LLATSIGMHGPDLISSTSRSLDHEQQVVNDVRSEQVLPSDGSTCPPYEHWYTRFMEKPLPSRYTVSQTCKLRTSSRDRQGCSWPHRHPDVYGAIFCASPGAGYKPTEVMPSRIPRTYLVAGTQEPFFLENATRWAAALRGAGADVVMKERVGSHGGAFWREEFPLMVAWAFGRE